MLCNVILMAKNLRIQQYCTLMFLKYNESFPAIVMILNRRRTLELQRHFLIQRFFHVVFWFRHDAKYVHQELQEIL